MNRDIEKSAAIVRSALGGMQPTIGVILGSGLGDLANRLSDPVILSYKSLPGFPQPSVQGHAGQMFIGKLDGVPAIFMKGRVHLYEGTEYASRALKVMIRTLKSVGIQDLLITNAAGSLKIESPPGSIVAISDHINLAGTNPLVGPNDDEWGVRFPPMNNAWDKNLRSILVNAARKLDLPIREGVYAGMLGPFFETPAEITMLRAVGADTVGMSTVADCLVANHCGLRVVGCNTIVNLAAGMSDTPPSHEETLKWGAATGEATLSHVIVQFLKDYQAGMRHA